MNSSIERAALLLFDRFVDAAPADPDGWIAAACPADEPLATRLRALIRADRDDGASLGGLGPVEPGTPAAGDRPAGAPATAVTGSAWPGLPVLPPPQIGPYRLDELIGAGGMGAVYRALRNDGLFDQRVAIKFIRPLHRSLPAEAMVDAERRLLARMRHPGIAHILDAGTTLNGLPFLVMEYVEGLRLDRHAEAAALDLPARVALLREVCAAIAHAHQNLVLHCDLKPDNILVTAEGRPKLIDFGVARLQSLADSGLPLAYTRAYASPQRLAGEPARVDDDVYAMGVVLRDLVAEAPARGRRAATPPDAELDAIVAKATAADRAGRYAAIGDFDEDLRRWLGVLPVSAVPQRLAYRVRKLGQRHPWRVAAAGAALAGILVSVAGLAALYVRAEAARAEAEQRFGEVRRLANYLLFDLDVRLESLPGATLARRELVEQGQRYLDALGRAATGRVDLQQEVGRGLARLAEVQGVPGKPHVGEPEAARANLDRATRLLDGIARTRPQDWTVRRDVGRVRYLLALFAGARDNAPQRQLSLAREAAGELDAAANLIGPQTGDAAAEPGASDRAELQVLIASARLTEADALKALDRYQDAAAIEQAEEARLLSLPEALRGKVDFAYQSGRPAMLLGDSWFHLRRLPEALAAYRRATDRFEAALVRDPHNRRLLEGMLVGYWSLSGTLADLDRPVEALAEIERAVPLADRLQALDPANREAARLARIVHGHRAIMLSNLGRHDEAIALTEANLAITKARSAQVPDDAEALRDTAVPLRTLARFHLAKGDRQAACRVLAAAIRHWTALDDRWPLSDRDRREELGFAVRSRTDLACPE